MQRTALHALSFSAARNLSLRCKLDACLVPFYDASMTIQREQLIRLIESELAQIEDARLRARVSDALVEPVLMQCAWEYGSPGERYPCWRVLEEPHSGPVGVVYCEYGFGPKCPWGLVWLHEAVPAMGQDSGWFPTFREAVADVLDMSPSSL